MSEILTRIDDLVAKYDQINRLNSSTLSIVMGPDADVLLSRDWIEEQSGKMREKVIAAVVSYEETAKLPSLKQLAQKDMKDRSDKSTTNSMKEDGTTADVTAEGITRVMLSDEDVAERVDTAIASMVSSIVVAVSSRME